MREIYRRRRDLVTGSLREQLGDVCRIPQAGMFLLMDIRGTGMSGGEFCRTLYRDCGVSVLDAGAFGASATGFVRLSFTLDEARLAEGCRRIINFIKRHQTEGVTP
jgi:arginine:pyruvate transaminase